jgi:abortive infection bacteriophage resistance protein
VKVSQKDILVMTLDMKYQTRIGFWNVCTIWEAGKLVEIEAQMMEAVRTSETSVNFNMTTWHYMTEDSKLHFFKPN